LPGARAALRERDFRLFWLSLISEGLALSMATVAVGWQVYAIDGDPLDLGLVGLAEFLPLPLLALPAGHLADRVSRRAVLVGARLLDTAVLLALLGVTLAGPDHIWPFLVLAFATGVASAVGAPAGRAMTPSLVPEELLAAAFALRSVAFQVAIVVGPAVGGLLFALRAELVYATGAALTLLSLVFVARLGSARTPAPVGGVGLDSVLAGVRLIRRTRVLLGAISLDLFAVLFGGAVALLPAFAKDILHVGPTGLGVLRSAPAVGALAAGLVLTRRPVQRRVGPVLLTVVALFGVATIVFGLSRTLWLSVLALAVAGAADMVSVVLRQLILPFVTPDALRGRVTAVEMVFISASNELGAFESGVAAALLGLVPAVVLGGAATVVIAALWPFLFRELARADRVEELRPV
jgi:predicted MFS family arabinose efflux permease